MADPPEEDKILPPRTRSIGFGLELHARRHAMRLSQADIATATGIPVPTLSHWENHQAEPRLSAVIVLANFFDITLDEMVGRKR